MAAPYIKVNPVHINLLPSASDFGKTGLEKFFSGRFPLADILSFLPS
jgi:hypothetical protein